MSCRSKMLQCRAVVLLLVAVMPALRALTIDTITIQSKYPDYRVPQEMVENCIVSKVGADFDRKVVAEDIRRLMASGYFDDVETQQGISGDRMTLTFVLTPAPRVRKIYIEGAKEVKEKKLRDVLTIREGDLLVKRQTQDEVNAMRKLYQDKGYYQTQINSLIQPIPDTHDVNLVFRIAEEPRYKVRAVRFAGSRIFKERELRARLLTKHSFWSRIFNVGYLDEEKLKLDEDTLFEAYTDKGHLDFRIEKIERELDAKKKWVTLKIYVVEGEPYTVASIRVNGNRKFTAEDLLKATKMQAGQRYDGAVEKRDTEAMRAKYEVLGYLDLKFFPRRQQNAAAHTVDIIYEVEEGVPSHVHDVTITGNEVTQDHVIRRELTLMPGDLGDAGKMRESKARLIGMDYFSTVDITHSATEREAEKDINVAVAEKKTGQLALGAGFSSEEDIIGTLTVTQANFDLYNWPYFTGGGQKLQLRLQAGTESSDFGLSFTEPWFLDRRLMLDFDLYHRERDQDYFDQTTTGTRVAFTKELRKFWRHSLGYRLEQVTIDSMDDGVGNDPDGHPLTDQEGDYTVSALVYRITRNTTNSPRYPTRGSRATFSTEVGPSFLGSYEDVYRLNIEGSKYFPVFGRSVLKIEGELGVVDGDEVAIFDRYYAGGVGTIRGFDRREIGPVDNQENATGGHSLYRGTVELMTPLYDMIRGSVFTDFGNVAWDSFEFSPSDVNLSIGVGLQLDLPIGPIRLDYGFPIITSWDHLDGNGGRFHFNVMYSF